MMPATASPTAGVLQPADPYAIFMRARSAVTAARYPDKIDYTIAISGLDGAQPRANHYRATSRPDEGVVDVAPLSQEEAAKPPPVPHGFNFAFTIGICSGRCETGSGTVVIPAGRSPAVPDLLGVPLLAPTYMFGLAYQRRFE
ncbi:MAG TPA: hypothetical protein VIJ77_06780, partial [Candidatus Tumulicola sp.]